MPTVAQRQKLWEKLTSDPDAAAKCQILESKSDEEKLHSMLVCESYIGKPIGTRAVPQFTTGVAKPLNKQTKI